MTGWSVVTIDLRATGKLAQPRDAVGRAPDHNSAEWSLWIGRPLLGQWTWDVKRLLDTIAGLDKGLPKRVAVIGRGPAGIVALSAAAVDPRITHVAAVDSLASYISDVPYEGQRLGVIAPGILREIGDVAHLAALCAPRRVVIAGPVWGNGKALATGEELRTAFAFAERAWKVHSAGENLRLVASQAVAQIVDRLK